MNGLRIIIDASCIFHKSYFTFYNRDWNSNSVTNFGTTCGKCSMKLLSDTAVEIGISEQSTGNYFIKIIFDNKIEIVILEISNVLNFNKF